MRRTSMLSTSSSVSNVPSSFMSHVILIAHRTDNNYCEVSNAGNANDWDFESWDNWAKTQAINKNVKIYIGAPASPTAAGSGYVDATTLGNIALTTQKQYSSFGGVMLWDASQAYGKCKRRSSRMYTKYDS